VLAPADGAFDGRRTLAHARLAALNFASDSTLLGKIEPLPEKFGFGICGYPFLRTQATKLSIVVCESPAPLRVPERKWPPPHAWMAALSFGFEAKPPPPLELLPLG